MKTYAPRSGEKYKRNSLAAAALESDPAEARLEADFYAWWQSQGIEPQDLKISLPSGGTLEPDLFIPDLNLVVEAKASTATESVRMALGQVLDYVFMLNHNSDSVEDEHQDQIFHPAILLPTRPQPRLLQLLSAYQITVYWPDNDGKGFVEFRAGEDQY